MLTCASCGGLTPRGSSRACLHCDAPLARPPRWALRASALLGPVGALLLAACYGGAGRYNKPPAGATPTDLDRDGSPGAWACGDPVTKERCEKELPRFLQSQKLDCDDADAARYPGAPDAAGDGIDQNCDGVDGDGARPRGSGAAPAGSGAAPAGSGSGSGSGVAPP